MLRGSVKYWLAGASLILLVLAGLTLAFQRPLQLALHIGRDEGWENDQPFVVGFHEPEFRTDTLERYRWTTQVAQLVFPDWPRRPAVLTLTQNNGVAPTLTLAGWQLQGLDVGRTVHLFVPPTTHLTVGISVPQLFDGAAGDPRELGAALQGGSLSTTAQWAWPPLSVLLSWAAVLGAVLLMVQLLGGGVSEGLLFAGFTGAGGVLATWAAPLRVSLAAPTLGLTVVYGLALAMGLLLALRRSRFFAAVPPSYLRWLVLATTVVWSLKLGGRMLPASMPGDIGFHRNRVLAVMIGDLFRPSLHRGVQFPYPPALYVLLQPLTLTGISIEWLLQLAAAACEALVLPLLFALVYRLTAQPRAALLSAILYGAFPAGYMVSAWSFDSHIFSQAVTLVWSVALIWLWERWAERRVWLGLLCGLILVALGHFGFYINISLLSGLLIVLLWWRGARRAAKTLALLLVITQVIVWAIYYSAFIDLFLRQGEAVAADGVSGINHRATIPRGRLAWETFYLGFVWHFALIPLLLAPFGWRRLWRSTAGRPAALVIGATWCVSAGLGLLPIVTGVPLTTRWLMFSAWGLAVCGGVALDWLWRWRPLGRWAALIQVGVIVAAGWAVWLQAIVYRIRPPEPF